MSGKGRQIVYRKFRNLLRCSALFFHVRKSNEAYQIYIIFIDNMISLILKLSRAYKDFKHGTEWRSVFLTVAATRALKKSRFFLVCSLRSGWLTFGWLTYDKTSYCQFTTCAVTYFRYAWFMLYIFEIGHESIAQCCKFCRSSL